jgi:hypothetical protein
MLTFLARGLWLSVPIGALSLAGMLGDIQPLVVAIILGIAVSLPWGLPGLVGLFASGAHGVSESQALVVFWLSSLWLFISITVNGAFITGIIRRVKGNARNPKIQQQFPVDGAAPRRRG